MAVVRQSRRLRQMNLGGETSGRAPSPRRKMNYTLTHLSDEDIARYCGRRLPPVEMLAADDHLVLCDSCYARMGAGQGLDDKLLVAGKAFDATTDYEVTHLTYEQMAAMADNRLDDIDREVIESHLELCRRCETELKDLREVSSSLDVSPAEQHVLPTPRAPSLRERLISLWRRPAYRMPAPAFAALAVVALAALLIHIPLRRERAELRARVAELEQGNQALKGQATAAEGMQDEVAAMRDENDRLRQAVESRAEVLVALNDGGGRVTLDTDGNLLGVRAGLRDEQTIKDALKNGRVSLPPSLRELRGGQSGTLMGDARTGFKLLTPVGVVIESDQPSLRWSVLEGAASYTVTIYDSSLTEVIASGPLTTTQWAVPTALARGRTYVWQVRAVKDGGEVVAPPPAGSRIKFKVLEQAKVEEVERARRSHAKSHLVMGLVYAEAGLLDEAAREFDALLRNNPQSPIARRLLQNVRSGGLKSTSRRHQR